MSVHDRVKNYLKKYPGSTARDLSLNLELSKNLVNSIVSIVKLRIKYKNGYLSVNYNNWSLNSHKFKLEFLNLSVNYTVI